MKKNDFVTTIEEMIAEKKKTTATIRDEVATLEKEIATLQIQIEAFTDDTDVKGYSNLKNTQEIKQHKLEALKQKLNSNAADPEDPQTTAILNGFITEVNKHDDENGAEMLVIIKQLEEKLNEYEQRREYLRGLYDSWIDTYHLPGTMHGSYPTTDRTGITPGVKMLIGRVNNLKSILN